MLKYAILTCEASSSNERDTLAMKLHLTQSEGNQLITAYKQGEISINHQKYQQSLIVFPQEVILTWEAPKFDDLTEAHFALFVERKPEVVMLGTGSTHRFIHPKLISQLTALNIPVECMTTDAACRTYNILMSEGRSVAAALIV